MSDPAALTLHNTLLQHMYNAGYVGMAAPIAGLLIVAWRDNNADHPAPAAILGVLFMASTIQVFLEPSFRAIPFTPMLALAGVCAAHPKTRPR